MNLLASEGYSGFDGASLVLLVGAIVAAGAWFLVFAWRWFATRPILPDPGVETREVGTEAPAIVNLLVNRWRPTRSAVQATMLDLASHKFLAIDQYGHNQFVVRLRRDPPQREMTPYESQVMDLIRERATGGSAPAEALHLGEDKEAEAWWKRFSKSVEEDARNLRLARHRWAPYDWAILAAAWRWFSGFLRSRSAVAHVGGRDSTGEDQIEPEGWARD